MSNLHWFVIAFIVIAALGYWNWQQSSQQLSKLQRSGFAISQDLKGTPKLVIDTQAKQLAVVEPTGFRTYGFEQIQHVQYKFDSNAQVDINHRIEIALLNSNRPVEIIVYEDEWIAQDKIKQLTHYLN